MKYTTTQDSVEAIQWTGHNITAVQDWLTQHARPFYKIPSQPNGFHTPQELHVRVVGTTVCVDIGISFGYRCAETDSWFLMSWAGLSVLTDELFKRNYSLDHHTDHPDYNENYSPGVTRGPLGPIFETDRDEAIYHGELVW